ncbi:hypothetical protein [Streptomyces violaceorubidus]|uniref:hypothetical protein n=1 Tax=Streptomyces violaceorubidus TaxID=284042 RepID=UPI0012FEA342|nr:hypothetical protein [Streptomyces violaceorubidus]
MTDSMPPDDGEPTSFREKAKDWVEKGKGWAEKHPRTIRFVKVAGVAAGMVAVVVLAPRSTDEDADEFPSYAEGSANAEDVKGAAEVEGVADQEQPSASDGTDNPRDSAKNHLRILHPGWNASEEKKAQYKEETGEDLPAGTTWVSPKSDADDSPEGEDPGADDSPEDEDSGETAA